MTDKENSATITRGSDHVDDKPSPSLTEGQIIANKFRLRELLGKSEFGEVWKAEHISVRTDDNEDVPLFALKFVSDKTRYGWSKYEDIRRAYKSIVGLKHRNICTVHPLEEDDQHGYVLVMEYIPGKTLWEHVNTKPHRKLAPPEVVQILTPIADALDYIHKRGLVHRDIRLGNIILAQDGEPQVIDFGLAVPMQNGKTSMGMKQGSMWYMAPEQWKGTPLDSKTDQYALGVVAYKLLAGRLPFPCADEFTEIEVVNSTAPPISGMSDSVNAVVAKAMAKEGQNRFDTCRDFADALTHAVLQSS